MCLRAQNLKFGGQNATKTIARHVPESVANLFLCMLCLLLQRLVNNAIHGPCQQMIKSSSDDFASGSGWEK